MPLRTKALLRLGLDKSLMNPQNIGYGDILDRLLDAIDISDNNLVDRRARRGPDTGSHRKLKGHKPGSTETKKLEGWICGFFKNTISDEDAFEQFCDLAGSNYDLVSYLFFLKDSKRYMPLSPETFDRTFVALDIELKTAHNASWSNYVSYMEALKAVHNALCAMDGLHGARLVDAHTFCFLLGTDKLKDRPASSLKKESPGVNLDSSTKHNKIPLVSVSQISQPGPDADDARQEPDAWDEVVQYLVAMTVNTVTNSNGQKVEVTKKLKDLWLSRSELSHHIQFLLKTQDYKCKLTGIEMQKDRSLFDAELYPSLDRIDSNGDYTAENTQMVCRFANRWKKDTQDGQFRKLISVVRGGSYRVD